tara:strand:+ start:172 stop:753 length:582 start_codon:yes stop_codon:yes gene_type:complete
MIGIYGGAFDPFHFGHLGAIKNALKQRAFTKIVIVPSYAHAYGKEMASLEKRIKWIENTIRDSRGGLSHSERQIMEVSNIEKKIHELKNGGSVYTADLILYFKKLFTDDLAFITGSDNDISKYYRYDIIESNCDIIEVPEITGVLHSSHIKDLLQEKVDDNERRRKEIKEKLFLNLSEPNIPEIIKEYRKSLD